MESNGAESVKQSPAAHPAQSMAEYKSPVYLALALVSCGINEYIQHTTQHKRKIKRIICQLIALAKAAPLARIVKGLRHGKTI